MAGGRLKKLFYLLIVERVDLGCLSNRGQAVVAVGMERPAGKRLEGLDVAVGHAGRAAR